MMETEKPGGVPGFVGSLFRWFKGSILRRESDRVCVHRFMTLSAVELHPGLLLEQDLQHPLWIRQEIAGDPVMVGLLIGDAFDAAG